MKRIIAFIYGVLSYLVFFGTFLWMVLFLGGFGNLVPTTVNGGGWAGVLEAAWPEALFINLALIVLFGIQHTIMARKAFKEKWTRIVPQSVERSTYVLFSSIALIILFWFWQPLNGIIWDVEAAWASLILQWGFWLGWLILFLSTWMIDHFNLFGVKQVYRNLRGLEPNPPEFMEPGFYKFVRHPLMLGFLIAFWSIPTMTVGHLIFSSGMTLYILVGVYYEEKAMLRRFGKDYKNYQERVPRFFPGLK